MSEQATILREARGLVDSPNKWTTGELARSADGSRRTPTAPDACAFCMVGAVLAITGDVWLPSPFDELLKKATDGTYLLGGWNDRHTHPEVMAAFDRAIALAEEA